MLENLVNQVILAKKERAQARSLQKHLNLMCWGLRLRRGGPSGWCAQLPWEPEVRKQRAAHRARSPRMTVPMTGQGRSVLEACGQWFSKES